MEQKLGAMIMVPSSWYRLQTPPAAGDQLLDPILTPLPMHPGIKYLDTRRFIKHNYVHVTKFRITIFFSILGKPGMPFGEGTAAAMP